MFKVFNPDNPVMAAWSKLTDLVILNVLWLLCCLPVITIGASTAALYSATGWLAEGNGKPVSRFFRTFKECFKTSTLLWLLEAIVGAVLIFDIYYIRAADFPLKPAVLILLVILAVIFSIVSVYIFPICARYQQGIRKTLKNCFLMAVAFLPKTIVMLGLDLIPLVFFLLLTSVFFHAWFIWVFLAFGLIAYINSKLLITIFRKVENSENDK